MLLAAADGAVQTIIRYGHGEISVTGWGWLFFILVASAMSASNYFGKD